MCAVDLFSKYVWVLPLKDKRGISIANPFQKIIWKGCKPNKISVDEGGEFYNKLFKRFLKINNIEMYLHTMRENMLLLKDLSGPWKRTVLCTWQLLQKMFILMCYKYNNIFHRKIKLKPINVTSGSYAEYNEDSNVPNLYSKLVITSEYQITKKFC